MYRTPYNFLRTIQQSTRRNVHVKLPVAAETPWSTEEFDCFLDQLIQDVKKEQDVLTLAPRKIHHPKPKKKIESGKQETSTEFTKERDPLIPKNTLDFPKLFISLFRKANSLYDTSRAIQAYKTHYGHPLLRNRGPPPRVVLSILQSCEALRKPHLGYAVIQHIHTLSETAVLNSLDEQVYAQLIRLSWNMEKSVPKCQHWLDEAEASAVRIVGLIGNTIEDLISEEQVHSRAVALRPLLHQARSLETMPTANDGSQKPRDARAEVVKKLQLTMQKRK